MFSNTGASGFLRGILTFFLEMSRKPLLDFANCFANKETMAIDIGCNIGYLTHPLSMRIKIIGLDIQKPQIRWAKKRYKQIDFICCDVCHLPLKKSSINLAVCGSVLEHIKNLNQALKEIKFTLTKGGKLVAGYPIETILLEIIIKSIFRSESYVWSQKNIMKKPEFLENPSTHKQNYSSIRNSIDKHLSILKKKKLPYDYLPDLLSIYEICVSKK
jgi:ubiquinone/menaquinone biosynthesis C-methylase UbiE